MRTSGSLLLLLPAIACVSCDRTPSSRAEPAPVVAAAEPTTLHFKVKGMSCEGCENAISETLAAMPGVIEVKAVHATGDVDVRTSDPTQRDAIAKAIEKLNYTVES